jgi:hypothetical protein
MRTLLLAITLLALPAEAQPGAQLHSEGARIRVCTSSEERALIEEIRRTTGQSMRPLPTHLTSPYDSQWFQVFEQLDLDEFGLPTCTAIQVEAPTGERVVRYKFSPSPTLLAMKAAMDQEVDRVAVSPREATRWQRLRSRVNWLLLAQTVTVTLSLQDLEIQRITVSAPWEEITPRSEERAVFARMRAAFLNMMPGAPQPH